jgi:integrase
MNQLSLFSTGADRAAVRPDADSEHLLGQFQAARLAEGAHPQSVRREVSQLRAVMREAGGGVQPVALRALFADLGLIARVLCEPSTPIARTTGRARLLAVQRFMTAMGRSLGRNPVADLDVLDAHLPARRTAGWHVTGTLVGGAPGRRRWRGPTLDASDLRRIVDAAGSAAGSQAARDRALVALHCFSGLRPDEIVRLRWEDLAAELTVNGRYGLTAMVERAGRRVALLLPRPAADPLDDLVHGDGGTIESATGPVMRVRGIQGRSLSYRAARDVLRDACVRAGLPPIDSAALRAACAHWLRTQGLSDHEVATVLGLERVRSIDRLLHGHAALTAQRAVRERLER